MDHPIWEVLGHQGRSMRWLARRIGYSEDLLTFVRTGRRRATAEFRSRCARALDLPESLLFHGPPAPADPDEPGADPTVAAS